MSTLTKIFIVLQLVFSLALSVVVIMYATSQPKYKDQVEEQARAKFAAQAVAAKNAEELVKATSTVAMLQDALANRSSVEKDLRLSNANAISKLERDGAGKDVQIAELNATIRGLTATNEGLKNQIVQLTEMLNGAPGKPGLQENYLKQLTQAEEIRRRNEQLTQENEQLSKALKRTQEELVQVNLQLEDAKKKGVGTGGGVTGPIPTAVAATINGSVGRVETRDGKTLLTLPLGTRDGIANGQVVIISRGNTYVADAEVINTTTDESVARVKTLNRGQQVRTGDIATVSR